MTRRTKEFLRLKCYIFPEAPRTVGQYIINHKSNPSFISHRFWIRADLCPIFVAMKAALKRSLTSRYLIGGALIPSPLNKSQTSRIGNDDCQGVCDYFDLIVLCLLHATNWFSSFKKSRKDQSSYYMSREVETKIGWFVSTSTFLIIPENHVNNIKKAILRTLSLVCTLSFAAILSFFMTHFLYVSRSNSKLLEFHLLHAFYLIFVSRRKKKIVLLAWAIQ